MNRHPKLQKIRMSEYIYQNEEEGDVTLGEDFIRVANSTNSSYKIYNRGLYIL